MDRQIVYPGAIPLETDLLNTNKYAMMGMAKLAAAIMGVSTYVRGLACTPSSPASMVVNVAAGEIYSLQNVDGTAYSSLAADTTHSVLKQGIAMDATAFTLTAPTTAGYSVNYLIQVTYSDVDSGGTVLPYYNAANPSVAYSGPNNSGAVQNTVRSGACTVAIKTGVAATTGTQTTPSPDAGYTGLYVITVAQGATTVTSTNIATYANSPFLPSGGLVDSIQRNTMRYAADIGSANAYVVNINPGILSLSSGMEVIFRAANGNTTSSTLNVCGLGAYPILSKYGATLVSGEIAANSLVKARWSSVSSSWFLIDATGAILTSATPGNPVYSTQLATTAFVKNSAPGIIGTSRNAKMVVTAASSVGTFTADELVVGSSVGGAQYRLSNISPSINISGTGVGGMDTGSAPATGYVAIYVIYNPISAAVSLLAVDATSAVAPEAYGGSNMPSGYSASALVAVWPTASSQFVIGNLQGRKLEVATRLILSSSTVNSSRVSLSTTQIPLNARLAYGGLSIGSTSASSVSLTVWGASQSVGGQPLSVTVVANGAYSATFSTVSVSGQTIGWSSSNTAGTPTFGIGINAYEI
jgi:hypothetical protein